MVAVVVKERMVSYMCRYGSIVSPRDTWNLFTWIHFMFTYLITALVILWTLLWDVLQTNTYLHIIILLFEGVFQKNTIIVMRFECIFIDYIHAL